MKHLGLALILISLTACSAFDRRSDQPDKTLEAPLGDVPSVTLRPSSEPSTPEMKDEKPLTDGIASPITEAIQNEPVDVTLQKASYLDEKHHDPDYIPPALEPTQSTEAVSIHTADEDTTTSTTPTKSAVKAETALKWLKNGNKRFLKPALRADGQSKKDIKRLINTETPHAVVFSSSDSRIPPEIIFDEKLGEIYVVRNLGLSVDTSVLNSIEYAVGTLGTELVLVMDRSYPGNPIDFSHADQTAQKLVDGSPILKNKLESNEAKVISAVYNIETGKVHFGK